MANFIPVYAVISKKTPMLVGFTVFGNNIETTLVGRDGITMIPISITDVVSRAESMGLLVQNFRMN